MNIAYLLPNLHLTGGSRVGIELGSRLVKRGHRFVIMIPTGRLKLEKKDNLEIIECGIRVGSPLIAVITGLIGMAYKLPKVDLVMASMPPHALLAAFLGKYRNIPAVNYILNDDVHFFDDGSFIKNKVLQKIYRTAARLSIRKANTFTNSHWTAVRCITEGGKRPTAIIPSGFDPAVFQPPEIKHETGTECRLVTVGRHMKWKGFADLFEALNLIDHVKHPFNLTVITQDNLDYPTTAFPVKILKPDSDKELVEACQSGDIFIHSSWFEGFGLPPLEAQACGVAVVATDSGGIREFLRNGDNALIAPPRDPVRLADAVRRLISDSELRDRLSDRGLETAREFTWDKIAIQFESALINIIECR